VRWPACVMWIGITCSALLYQYSAVSKYLLF
jgi:hypothetical protein